MSQAVNTAVSIVSAGWRDLPAVWRLERVCFGPDAWGVLDLVATLTIPGSVRLKAVAGGQLVGFVMGDPRQRQGFSWIATLAVLPAFQRRGIGALLLAAAEAALPTARIRLTVRQSNTGAIALYQQSGYAYVSTWPQYYANGEAGLVMEKVKG